MALVIDSVQSVPAAAASSLAPGFRFHPTDEELVRYYLRRKVCGKAFRFDAISDVDVYKVEPWDLPGLSRLKSRDLEWYFFSVLDKKYGNGARTNRATDRGYWKTTGKDRTVHHRSQLVGMKKTLVYHCGRAPKGERTNWVMHEYRLIDQELEKAGIVQDAFVLCRIFRKSGSGPKNGEQYGAPFVEEEWEDDELVMVSKQEDCAAEELPFDDDCYLDASDIDQILGTEFPEEDGSPPLDLHHGDNVNSAAMINEPSKLSEGVEEDERQVYNKEVPEWFDLPVQNGMDPNSVKHEYIGETSDSVNFDVDYLLDEPYFDATSGDLQLDERSFFEANDFDNAFKMDPNLDMLDEYTSYFDPAMDDSPYIFDSMGSDNITLENVYEQTHQSSEASQQLFEGQINDFSASSKQPDRAADTAYPFLKKASSMLGNIYAPPAFASEFPTKYMPSSQSPTSVDVTTGMLQIRNMSFNGSTVDWPLVKHGKVNIVLSFDLGQTDASSTNQHQLASVDSWKGNSAVSRSWFYCIFLWILVLSLTLKISSFISPRSFIN